MSHYSDHLEPIWRALPASVRGGSWAPRSGCWWGNPPPHRGEGSALVAGFADAQKMAGRPLVYVEHGAGQSYQADGRSAGHGSYSGGAGLERVVLFVCPSETVADRWRAVYPDTPAVAVGSPRLDRWHGSMRASSESRLRGASPGNVRDRAPHTPVVAVSFHWPAPLIQETMWAFPHYRSALAGLRDAVRAAGGELLGHGHPRAYGALSRTWRALGVPHTPSIEDVFAEADLLVADNTSALPEFCSLGRPVVWLSAPWYRRDVDHGGRFWSWPEGQVHCEQPDELVGCVFAALEDPPGVRAAREAMVRSVYASTDGRAAERAAAAILQHADP